MRAPMGLYYIVIILVTYCLCECNFKVERGLVSMPNAYCSATALTEVGPTVPCVLGI
jgi:hypothetical protein